MCRDNDHGGRRCPSSKWPEPGPKRDARNARRRELYHKNKARGNAQETLKKWDKNHNGLIEIPKNATKEQLAEIAKLDNVDVTIGRVSKESPLEAQMKAYQHASDELVSYFTDEDGVFKFPTSRNDYDGLEFLRRNTGELSQGDFKFVGQGVEKMAWYHEPTGLVYKIPYTMGKGRDADEYLVMQQHLIANVDDEALAENNLRYAKSFFMKSGNVAIFAQEYLPSDEYETFEISDDAVSSEGWGVMIDNHFNDFTGNIMKNKKTGEVVVFDCLSIGGHPEAYDQFKEYKKKRESKNSSE